jgi:RNA 3'-phosphate cyclase
MINIDGSYLEGGGQILRTSIALSCLTKKPIHIFNIRAGRKPPGLKAQHLAAIKAVNDLCDGELKGATIGSKEIWLYPQEIKKDFLKVEISTAGSVSLVLQTIFLASLNIEKKLNVEINGGGTFGKWAPSVVYLENVFSPVARKFGFEAEIKVVKHGFYPRGGAKVTAKIYPSKLEGYEIVRKIEKVEGISIASENLRNAKVSERQRDSVKEILKDFEADINLEYVNTLSTGTAIELWNNPTRIGTSCLGEIGLKAEKVGEIAARELLEELNSGANVDKHLADQLIPFMALANGKSSYLVRELTNHTKTNVWVTEKFVDRKFKLEKINSLFKVSI